jgi:thiamine-phosphate pyrophosphorylase
MFELKRDKKIFIVTNRHLIEKGNIYDVIEKCAANGADGVILREKDLAYDSLKKMAEGIKNITDKYNIPLIINGNIDVAKNVNAYGFHTGVYGFKRMSPMSQVISKHEEKEGLECTFAAFRGREYDSKKLVLGVSVHSSEEAIEAEKLGAQYLIAGHVFETECKPGLKARGIEFIQKVCESVKIPVIAIGGITPNNLNEVLNTKVFGVAVMSYGMKI